MNQYSLYDAATGIFTGVSLSCQDCDLQANIPDGQRCIIGHYEQLSQKVDIESGSVHDYQPPQPSTNHFWNQITKRWVDYAFVARAQRDRMLAASDWMITRQIETGIPVLSDWVKFRQDLRDISKQDGFPENIIWPVAPGDTPTAT